MQILGNEIPEMFIYLYVFVCVVNVLNPPQTVKVEEKVNEENKGLSRSGSGLQRFFTHSLYLQPAGARGRHTPEPSPAHSGPQGPATHRTADLL